MLVRLSLFVHRALPYVVMCMPFGQFGVDGVMLVLVCCLVGRCAMLLCVCPLGNLGLMG